MINYFKQVFGFYYKEPQNYHNATKRDEKQPHIDGKWANKKGTKGAKEQTQQQPLSETIKHSDYDNLPLHRDSASV